MSLFGNIFGNYSKPGPGVSKEQEDRSQWANYFVVFKRHLSKLTKLNLVFMIPFLICIAAMVGTLFIPVQHLAYLNYNLWVMYVLTIPLVFLSPFWGGVYVVARRIAKQEYVFVWDEYWKGVKDNWKQFLGNGIICYLAYVFTTFSLIYYTTNISESWLNYIPSVIIIFFAILFILAQFYMPILIVSIELPLKSLFKNAFIFGILGIIRNIIFAVVLIILGVFYMYFSNWNGFVLIFAAVVIIFYLFSFIAYTNSYLTIPILNKYIISPPEPEQFVEQLDEDSDEAIFEDIL